MGTTLLGTEYGGVAPGIPDALDDRLPDDNQVDREAERDTDEPPQYGDPETAGPLMTLPPRQAVAYAIEMWTDQRERYHLAEVAWEVNERRRGGETNIWAMKRQDEQSWFVWVPPGSSQRLPVPTINKADRLCGRVTAKVFSDPAEPEAEKENGDPASRDAAEFEERVLKDVDSEATLDDPQKHRMAFDAASSTGHYFIQYSVNPYDGGRMPVQIEAGAQAQSVEDATEQSIPDPMGGEPQRMPWPELILRYVTPDGTLTDDESEAALRWAPQIASRLVHPRHVRLWPESATNIWNADMVLCAGYHTIGTLKRWFPDLAQWSDTDLAALAKQRPPLTDRLLPKKHGKPHDPERKHLEDRLVFAIWVYAKECHSYSDGLEFIALGTDGRFLTREPWVSTAGGGRMPLDLPFTQHIQGVLDPESPIHVGLMSVLGPGNEFRAGTIGNVVDLSDKNLSLKTFVPTNSILSGKEAMLPFLTYVPINPGGEPKREDAYPIPQELFDLLKFATAEMDDASGLQQAGQGLETPDAQSGRAKLAVLGEVQTGMSGPLDYARRAITRGWRIKGQLIRAKYDVPQLMAWEGPDGDYKRKRWMGADLGSTRQIRIKPGSFSMMSNMQKADRAVQLAAIPGVIAPDDLRDYLFGGVSSEMGWQDNPHLMRVRHQIARWEDGPDETVQQQSAQYAQQVSMMGPLPVDPAIGQPQVPPDPMLIAGSQLFAPRMVDTQMDVAPLRLRELGRAMASAKYGQFQQAAPAWALALDQAYQAMVQALTPPPMPAVDTDGKPIPPEQSAPQNPPPQEPAQ